MPHEGSAFEDLESHFKDRIRQVLMESKEGLPTPEQLKASVDMFLDGLRADRDLSSFIPRYKVIPSVMADGLSHQVSFEVTVWDPNLARRLRAYMDKEYQALIERIEKHYGGPHDGMYVMTAEEEAIARRHMPEPITVTLTASKVELKAKD